VHDGIGARWGHGGTGTPPVLSISFPALAGTVASGKALFCQNRALPARDRARKGWERWNWLAARARGHRQNFTKALRAAGRPSEGGLASLEARAGGVHDRIGALPDGIGLCPLATVPARAGHGGTVVEPS